MAADRDLEEGAEAASESSHSRLWLWRERIRARRTSRLIWKTAIAVIGLAIVGGGLALVPLPGPGWLIVFVGLAVLATEFEPADRLLQFARRRLEAWTDWLRAQGWPVRILVGLATFAFVLGVVYALFAVMGLPAWLPSGMTTWLSDLPGLGA